VKIIYIILLLSTLARADNISYCGMLESSEYWRDDGYSHDFYFTSVQKLSYSMDIKDKSQRISFLAEHTSSGYNTKFLGLGGNWLSIGPKIFNSGAVWQNVGIQISDQICYTEFAFGPQLVAKYTNGETKALYLAPSMVLNINNYISRFGYIFYGEIGYNCLLTQSRSEKLSDRKMQSDVMIRLGLGALVNFSGWKSSSDFE